MNIFKKLYCFIFGHKINFEENTPSKGCYCSRGCGKLFTSEEISIILKNITGL